VARGAGLRACSDAAAPEAIAPALRLRITEVFVSLQGETVRAGLPTVFVRLTGCPLRCRWCDSAYAFGGGVLRDLDDLMREVTGAGLRQVCVTGGEPLAQPACLPLLSALCDAGLSVSLETSGALDASRVDARVARVFDLKPPGSGECERNHWPNFDPGALRPHDAVKFVLADRRDYEWARAVLLERRLDRACEVLLSPVHGELPPADLAAWILEDRLPVRLQLQQHKLIWGDVPGR
jgi:7-carboxy-7-deazaguanine synthase